MLWVRVVHVQVDEIVRVTFEGVYVVPVTVPEPVKVVAVVTDIAPTDKLNPDVATVIKVVPVQVNAPVVVMAAPKVKV